MAQDVHVVGWVAHKQGIAIIQLIRDATGCGLKEAMDTYGSIIAGKLTGERITLHLQEGRDPEVFKRDLRELGILCE